MSVPVLTRRLADLRKRLDALGTDRPPPGCKSAPPGYRWLQRPRRIFLWRGDAYADSPMIWELEPIDGDAKRLVIPRVDDRLWQRQDMIPAEPVAEPPWDWDVDREWPAAPLSAERELVAAIPEPAVDDDPPALPALDPAPEPDAVVLALAARFGLLRPAPRESTDAT